MNKNRLPEAVLVYGQRKHLLVANKAHLFKRLSKHIYVLSSFFIQWHNT